MKEKTKKVFSYLGTIIVIISFIVLGIGVYQKITNKKLIPYQMVWVLTASMEDTIPSKSYILVKDIDASKVKVDDVICFISRDKEIECQLNTHRVKQIIGNNEEFITKGDNNLVNDSLHVYASEIEGIYICNLPILTFIGRVFVTKAGLALTFLIFTFMFIILGKQNKKQLEKESKEKAIQEAIKKEVARLEEEKKKDR